MPSLRLLIGASAAAAALATPTAASASLTEAEYRVDLDTYVYWSIDRFEDLGGHETRALQAQAVAHVQATIEHVLFRNGRMVSTDPWANATVSVDGGGTETETHWNADKQRVETVNGSCTAVPGTGWPGRALLSDPVGDANGYAYVQVRLAEYVLVQLSCDKTPGATYAWSTAAPAPSGVFDTVFGLPHEAIGMGLIIEKIHSVSGQQAPQYCPGKDASTRSCEFRWDGKATFTKTGGGTWEDVPVTDGDAGQGAATVAPTVSAAPASGVAPSGAAVALAATAVAPRTASLSRAGDRVSFVAACPTGCRGTAVLRTAGRARAAATLGRLRFTVPAGAARTVTVKVPERLRRGLRRARVANLAVTLTPNGGGAPSRATLRLRAARPAK